MNTVSIMSQPDSGVSDSVTERWGGQRFDLRAIDDRHLATTQAYPALAFEALQVPRDDLSSRAELHRDVMVGDFLYDLQAGRAAGITTVHLDPDGDHRWPQYTDVAVTSLDALVPR